MFDCDDTPNVKLSFDGAVELVLRRLALLQAVDPSRLHSFKEVIGEEQEQLPNIFYYDAFEYLQLWGFLHPASRLVGGDALGKLSADGLDYVRQKVAA